MCIRMVCACVTVSTTTSPTDHSPVKASTLSFRGESSRAVWVPVFPEPLFKRPWDQPLMRKWLRFTLPLNYTASPRWDLSMGWSSRTGHDGSGPSHRAIPSILDSIDAILWKIDDKLDAFSDDRECHWVQEELHAGLAWITSSPVHTWYSGLGAEAQVAFSAWVIHLSRIPDKYVDTTGPIIASSYLVSVPFPRPVAEIKRQGADITCPTAGMASECRARLDGQSSFPFSGRLYLPTDRYCSQCVPRLTLSPSTAQLLRLGREHKFSPFPGSQSDPKRKHVLETPRDFEAFLVVEKIPLDPERVSAAPTPHDQDHSEPEGVNATTQPPDQFQPVRRRDAFLKPFRRICTRRTHKT